MSFPSSLALPRLLKTAYKGSVDTGTAWGYGLDSSPRPTQIRHLPVETPGRPTSPNASSPGTSPAADATFGGCAARIAAGRIYLLPTVHSSCAPADFATTG